MSSDDQLPTQKDLARLVRTLPPGLVQDIESGEKNVVVEGIVLDSRQVHRGEIFVAVAGGNVDGHEYIGDAIQRGASAVVGSKASEQLPVPYIRVADSRLALAHLAASYYGFPARQMTVVGVTGTDGKTTTTTLIYHILKAAGYRVGMVSTVTALIGDIELDTGYHVTTPESPDLQRYLAEMVNRGITHAVLETTSHGLAQQRVAACDFDFGVVTNITHEHLDYHGNYFAYREAKARMFVALAEHDSKPGARPRAAILNRDDQSFDYLNSIIPPGIKKTSYGIETAADVVASQINLKHGKLRFKVQGLTYGFDIVTGLVGEYNIYNCLAATALAVDGLGLDPGIVQEGIANLPSIPGRMEIIDLGQPFRAIVDFAHTPNALRRALLAARGLITQSNSRGRVIAVFGSAGLRDREKRRLMAEVSAELADITILTAEDPRTESLSAILAEMAQGAQVKGAVEGVNFWRIRDRGEAIRFGIKMAQPGDIVLALGKGHEQSMCFGDIEYAWDDRVAMKSALAEYMMIKGPQMPYLPTQEED